MIKVNSLFKNPNLQKLSKEAKLFYIYLITNPEMNILGVCSLNINIVSIQLDITINELRNASKELIESDLIKVFSGDNGVINFIALQHYKTQPKGNQTIKKAKAELEVLQDDIKEFIDKNFDLEAKNVTFIEPTVEEIEDFANSCGYGIDGNQVIEYYRGRAEFYRKKTGWYDGKGRQVIDWKRKVRNVWCKDDRKLQENPDAPKDFKFFHITVGDKQVYPDYWKEGKPYSRSGIIETTELQQAYERKRNS